LGVELVEMVEMVSSFAKGDCTCNRQPLPTLRFLACSLHLLICSCDTACYEMDTYSQLLHPVEFSYCGTYCAQQEVAQTEAGIIMQGTQCWYCLCFYSLFLLNDSQAFRFIWQSSREWIDWLIGSLIASNIKLSFKLKLFARSSQSFKFTTYEYIYYNYKNFNVNIYGNRLAIFSFTAISASPSVNFFFAHAVH